MHVVRPAPGSASREYGIVRRFSDAQSRDRFYRSALFKSWEQRIAQLTEGGPVRQELSGLEAWFSLPGQTGATQPPRWKMAMVTVLGVWPVSILVPWLLLPLVGESPPLAAGLCHSGGDRSRLDVGSHADAGEDPEAVAARVIREVVP